MMLFKGKVEMVLLLCVVGGNSTPWFFYAFLIHHYCEALRESAFLSVRNYLLSLYNMWVDGVDDH